jgi:hypothetical protein
MWTVSKQTSLTLEFTVAHKIFLLPQSLKRLQSFKKVFCFTLQRSNSEWRNARNKQASIHGEHYTSLYLHLSAFEFSNSFWEILQGEIYVHILNYWKCITYRSSIVMQSTIQLDAFKYRKLKCVSFDRKLCMEFFISASRNLEETEVSMN